MIDPFFNQVTEAEEAELRVMTKNMYDFGGAINVLECIQTMRQVELIILTKLNEIIEEEKQ